MPRGFKYKFKYTTQDEVYYHEGMAQYFTNEIIKGSNLRNSVFNWLFPKQIKRYRIFLNLSPKYSFNDVMAGLVTTSIFDEQDWSLLLIEIAEANTVNGSIEDKVQHCI